VLCVKCKGRNLCRTSCPILDSFRSKNLSLNDVDEKPTPPSVFVGRIGYPRVFAGPMIVLGNEKPEFFENPASYSKNVEEVLALRMSLARTYKNFSVFSALNPDKLLLELQEIAASLKDVDVEGEYEKIIKKPAIDDIVMPSGISAVYKKIRVTSNPKIPSKLEKVAGDDIKAVDAVRFLHESGYPTSYLQRVLSVGLLGIEKRLVPTRWSITAVHDMIAEELKKEIRYFDEISEVLLFSYEHYGNHFEVIFYPSCYAFQLVEIWIEKSLWSPERTWIGADWEGIKRKSQYSELSGGYYAARLPVVEFMHRIRRQAGAIVIREIRPEYSAPLGVWVVEEGVREALNSKPEKFEDLKDALRKAESRIKTEGRLWKKHIKLFFQPSLDQYLGSS